MPYATLQDVKDAAPQLRITQTSKPDEADAQRIVTSVNDEVDGVCSGLGYTVPVTGTKSVAILKDIVVKGSIAKLLKAMFYGVRNPDEVGANGAWKEYRAALQALIDPDDPLTLPDAQQNQQAAKVAKELYASALEPVEDEELFKPTRDQEF